MKLAKNNEIEKILDRIKSNVLDTISNTGTKAYEGKMITSEIRKSLEESYARLGVEIDIEQSVSSVKDIAFNRDVNLSRCGSKNLKQYKLKAGQLVAMDYSHHDRYLEEWVELGYYTKDLVLPQIIENGNLWMCPTMMEYKTMKHSINRSHGNVLVFGCGIGFYQYMSLLRDEVEKMTIVELNSDIINNFKENILSQFNIDKEITIIQGNAFDYFNDVFMKDYDSVFVDIWFNNNDGLEIYSELMKKQVTHSHIDYWIEDSILLEIKRYIFLYLWDMYQGTLSNSLRVHPITDIERGMSAVHKVLRSKELIIETEEQLLNLLNNEVLIKEILRMYKNNV